MLMDCAAYLLNLAGICSAYSLNSAHCPAFVEFSSHLPSILLNSAGFCPAYSLNSHTSHQLSLSQDILDFFCPAFAEFSMYLPSIFTEFGTLPSIR